MPEGVPAAATVSNKGGPAAATMMLCTLELEEEDKQDDSANLGGPSPKICCLVPNLRITRPKNYFDTQLTPNYMGWLVQATNPCAVADGAGSGTYADFVLFNLPKLYKFVGLLFANSLTPKPQFEYWFEGQEQEPLFGNDKYARAVHKHVCKGHKVSGKH
jgi:hypothetical protein